MAALSPAYPHKGIDLGTRIQPLPSDGLIPGLLEWRWLHTPGHTPGHVSLFRERDRSIIAGDAFITVKQESALAVLTQEPEVHGPPMYFTTDWDLARNSVKTLAELRPEFAFTGHGQPMSGESLRKQLHDLSTHFDTLALPEEGRYVNH